MRIKRAAKLPGTDLHKSNWKDSNLHNVLLESFNKQLSHNERFRTMCWKPGILPNSFWQEVSSRSLADVLTASVKQLTLLTCNDLAQQWIRCYIVQLSTEMALITARDPESLQNVKAIIIQPCNYTSGPTGDAQRRRRRHSPREFVKIIISWDQISTIDSRLWNIAIISATIEVSYLWFGLVEYIVVFL